MRTLVFAALLGAALGSVTRQKYAGTATGAFWSYTDFFLGRGQSPRDGSWRTHRFRTDQTTGAVNAVISGGRGTYYIKYWVDDVQQGGVIAKGGASLSGLALTSSAIAAGWTKKGSMLYPPAALLAPTTPVPVPANWKFSGTATGQFWSYTDFHLGKSQQPRDGSWKTHRFQTDQTTGAINAVISGGKGTYYIKWWINGVQQGGIIATGGPNLSGLALTSTAVQAGWTKKGSWLYPPSSLLPTAAPTPAPTTLAPPTPEPTEPCLADKKPYSKCLRRKNKGKCEPGNAKYEKMMKICHATCTGCQASAVCEDLKGQKWCDRKLKLKPDACDAGHVRNKKCRKTCKDHDKSKAVECQ